MPQSLDACFFVDEIPDIIYEDGLFHIVQTVGNYRFERVMRPSVFMATIVRAVEAARQHRMGSAEIINVDFDSKFERVYKKDPAA